jgi:hypothetical protein
MIPVLLYYNPKLDILVETNISNFVIGVVLSLKEDRVLLIAFYSRQMTTKQLNYYIYNKDILAIISVF